MEKKVRGMEGANLLGEMTLNQLTLFFNTVQRELHT